MEQLIEADARSAVPSPLARLLALAPQPIGNDALLTERVAEIFPWMLDLSDESRTACARDLREAARAALSAGDATVALAELVSWRETAAAIAAGLGAQSVEWLDEQLLVERPVREREVDEATR